MFLYKLRSIANIVANSNASNAVLWHSESCDDPHRQIWESQGLLLCSTFNLSEFMSCTKGLRLFIHMEALANQKGHSDACIRYYKQPVGELGGCH